MPHERQLKSSFHSFIHEHTGVMYQSSNESKFLDYCHARSLKVERGPVIDYCFNGKYRKYFPDFFLTNYNLVIEVKCEYTYLSVLKKNLTKKKATKSLGYEFLFVIDNYFRDLDQL